MDKSATPRQASCRNSSAPRRVRTGGRALDGALTARTRRVSRLDSALEDARTNSGDSPFCTPRLVRKQMIPVARVSAVDTLQTVYDKVEQRNNALIDLPARIPTLSPIQLQSARQAVHVFVDQMRGVADAADTQARTALARALINDVMLPEGTTNSRIAPSRQQNNEAEGLNQLNDVSCWYLVGKEIGRGTFGRVRFATHRLSGTPVAIKSYARLHGARSCLAVDAIGKRGAGDCQGDALEWRRVRQEVNVLSRLHAHPNIMRFVEVFETPTRIHAVTELVKGTSLCDILRHAPGQRLPEARAKGIFRQIVAGVAALHAQRVIHRDLKLENILLDESSGHATVIDFGFSDFEDCNDPEMPGPAEDAAQKKRSRKKKNFCGTPSYMAPEVVASERYDGRPVDVWSLGVLLYVILCGKFPFQGVSFHQLYQKLRSGSQQLVLPLSLSNEARALLQSVLVADPVKRPTASELCCCSWLQDTENPKSSNLQLTSALRKSFEAWPGITPAICSALTQYYGVQLSVSSLESGSQQPKRLRAFIDLATVELSRHFEKSAGSISSPAPSSTDCAGSNQKELTDPGHREPAQQVVESSTRHKQQLEKLIGLVKTSLETSTQR